MARSPHTWGLDVGKCAVKAVRGRMSATDPPRFVADAFDYIEYPMILSQPEADPIELVQRAIADR